MNKKLIILFLTVFFLVGCDKPEKAEEFVKVCPPEIAATIKPTLEDQHAIWVDRRTMEPLELFTVSGLHLKIPRQYVVDLIRTDECGRVTHFSLSLFWTGSEFEPYRYNAKNDPVSPKFRLGKVSMSWWPKIPGSELPPSPRFFGSLVEAWPESYFPAQTIIEDKLLVYSTTVATPINRNRSSHFELTGIRDPAGGVIDFGWNNQWGQTRLISANAPVNIAV